MFVGLPADYVCGRVALVHQTWVDGLAETGEVPQGEEDAFRRHPTLAGDEIQELIKERRTPDSGEWHLVELEPYALDKSASAWTLPPLANPFAAEEWTVAEALQFASQMNFVNLWREAFEAGSAGLGGGEEKRSVVVGRRHDEAFVEVARRICGGDGGDSDEASHVRSAVGCVVEDGRCVIVRLLRTHSVRDALDFSPSFLSDTLQKPLFIVYQLLLAMRELHAKGICLGDISLSSVSIDQKYYVTVKPDLSASVAKLEPNVEAEDGVKALRRSKNLLRELQRAVNDVVRNAQANNEERDALARNVLAGALDLWRHGTLSNLDYLMFLNYLCGRSCDNPKYYPVVPWVRDFTSEIGGWRDLSKSKFRLNKGDTQLDLTYDSLAEMNASEANPRTGGGTGPLGLGAAPLTHHHQQGRSVAHQPPHHVTEVLSEITYYVYKSRRTSRLVLCKHVRNRWVPAEYPSSMQRLQEWTPDECIPEFYTDPEIFKSVHDDLADLEVPQWCSDSDEFVAWHRAALESAHVSEKLHLWIDLTFGCKLAGGGAVRAKNVCLPLVDNHSDLRRHGVVQLFHQMHPTRETPSQYWSKHPPRLDAFLGGLDSAEIPSVDSDVEEETKRKRSSLPVESDAKVQPTEHQRIPIPLPKDFDPLTRLNELEGTNAFLSKNGCYSALADPKSEPDHSALGRRNGAIEGLVRRRRFRDMRVLGCLIMEIFLPRKFLSLGERASLEGRMEAALGVLQHEIHLVPLCIRETVKSLLQTGSSGHLPKVTEFGPSPPTAFQLLCPTLSSLKFPDQFRALARVLRGIDPTQMIAFNSKLTKENRAEAAEFRVKLAASELQPFYDCLKLEVMPLLLPMIKELFNDSSTAVVAAWYLFEPIARILGPRATLTNLLQPILAIFEGSYQTSKHLKLYHRSFLQFLTLRMGTAEFLIYFTTYLIEAVGGYKDYEDDPSHHVCRKGLERLWDSEDGDLEQLSIGENVNGPLSKTTATNEDDDSGSDATPHDESLAEGEVFSFDSYNEGNAEHSANANTTVAKSLANRGQIYIPAYTIPSSGEDSGEEDSTTRRNRHSMTGGGGGSGSGGNIAQVASESVLWLANRVGPVLTAKFLSRNLLRMLNLCYAVSMDGHEEVGRRHPDSKIRIGVRRIRGDDLAQNVLECLSAVACLYGDQIILLQYLPYVWDLVALCKRRLTPNLEGGLVGCVSLLHHIIPYLSDSVLMNELPDNILANVLFPVLQITTSRSASFSGGWRIRKTLLYKFLDVVYLIGLRIGEEMARSHLTPTCTAFFSSFDKVYDVTGQPMRIAEETAQHKAVTDMMTEVLNSELAYDAYIAFYNLLGRAHLDASIVNLDVVKSLCISEQESQRQPAARPATFNCFLRLQRDSGGEMSDGSKRGETPDFVDGNGSQTTGNKIGHSSAAATSSSLLAALQSKNNDELHSLISKEAAMSATSASRHLRGNWLAYWEHEIGRGSSEKKFNLKQIKLQTFSGHVSGQSVKALHVLDSENSFLSAGGGRDKTVRVWSLRSQGDGNATVGCQWTFGQHKKSVFGVSFLQSSSQAVSCDGSALHVWDPFVGSPIFQVEPADYGPFLAMCMLPTPSSVVATAAQDSLLHLVDCRVGGFVADLKISIMGATGLIKCVRPSADGNQVIAGHGSGYVSVLDLRTGKLRSTWKAHEGEVLTITPVVDSPAAEIVTTSLDQTVSVWGANDGKLKASLPGAQEPIHCVAYLPESGDLVTGSTSNRLAVRHGLSVDAPFSSNKIRSDVMKGNLTSMHVLEMNRMLLLGQDNGQIILVC